VTAAAMATKAATLAFVLAAKAAGRRLIWVWSARFMRPDASSREPECVAHHRECSMVAMARKEPTTGGDTVSEDAGCPSSAASSAVSNEGAASAWVRASDFTTEKGVDVARRRRERPLSLAVQDREPPLSSPQAPAVRAPSRSSSSLTGMVRVTADDEVCIRSTERVPSGEVARAAAVTTSMMSAPRTARPS
jgi:hypothetical protein